MWIGTTSPLCTLCASASAPCVCAQPVCKCHLAPPPRYAPDASSSGSWGTFQRRPRSATLATYKRSISFTLAARATKHSKAASCGKARKVAGCATIARQKRGHTDAPPAGATKQRRSSHIPEENWKKFPHALQELRNVHGLQACIQRSPLHDSGQEAVYKVFCSGNFENMYGVRREAPPKHV